MNDNKMTLDGIITHEFKLDEINSAIELFRQNKAGRILIDLDG
jgi:Zn-dependent alcohol dehydrogenase